MYSYFYGKKPPIQSYLCKNCKGEQPLYNTTPGTHTRGKMYKNEIFSKTSSSLITCWVKGKYMGLISVKPSNKIVKFLNPGSRVQTLVWGHYGLIVKGYKILENLYLYFNIYLRKKIIAIFSSLCVFVRFYHYHSYNMTTLRKKRVRTLSICFR